MRYIENVARDLKRLLFYIIIALAVIGIFLVVGVVLGG